MPVVSSLLAEICLPDLQNRRLTASAYIRQHLEEAELDNLEQESSSHGHHHH